MGMISVKSGDWELVHIDRPRIGMICVDACQWPANW